MEYKYSAFPDDVIRVTVRTASGRVIDIDLALDEHGRRICDGEIAQDADGTTRFRIAGQALRCLQSDESVG